MQFRRTMVFLLTAIMLIISACSGSTGSNGKKSDNGSSNEGSVANDAAAVNGDDGPDTPFEKTVTVNIGKIIPTNQKYPEGDSVEDNRFTRLIEKRLNVKFTHAYQVPGDKMNEKVNLVIASGDLPDAFEVNETQFRQLVKADKLMDITELWEQYVDPRVRDYYEGSLAFEMAKRDGKQYAIPSINLDVSGVNLLWVRQDWLDKLGLQPPKTVDDVIAIAKEFMEKDPGGIGAGQTIGMPGPANGNISDWGARFGFDSIFASFGSYPNLWVKGDDGKAVSGLIQPETKEALAKIREMYEAGIIDKDFLSKREEQSNELINNGRSGLMFGAWWSGWPLSDSIKKNPQAEWKAYPIPVGADGKFKAPMYPPVDRYLVIRKDFKYPEAVLKTFSLEILGLRVIDPEGTPYSEFSGNPDVSVGWENWPFVTDVNYPDVVQQAAKIYSEAAKNGEIAEGVSIERKREWEETLIKEVQYPKKDPGIWGGWTSYVVGGGAMADPNIERIQSLFYGQTKTMGTKQATLDKLWKKTAIEIIVGEAPLEDFDKFVSSWKKLGGDQITREVNDELAN